jgi:hypothetical protein
MRFAPFFPTRHGAQKGAAAQLRIDHTTTAPAGRPIAPRFNPRLVPFPDPFDAPPFLLTLHRAKQGSVAGCRIHLGTTPFTGRTVAPRLDPRLVLEPSIIEHVAFPTAKFAAWRMTIEGQLDPALFAVIAHINQ